MEKYTNQTGDVLIVANQCSQCPGHEDAACPVGQLSQHIQGIKREENERGNIASLTRVLQSYIDKHDGHFPGLTRIETTDLGLMHEFRAHCTHSTDRRPETRRERLNPLNRSVYREEYTLRLLQLAQFNPMGVEEDPDLEEADLRLPYH